MYNCNLNDTIRSVFQDLEMVPRAKGLIDFDKYENWLRLLSVSRAAYLLELLGCKWDAFYVKWNNSPDDSLLQTSIHALTIKPEFLSKRPQDIWCSFIGGPPSATMTIRSSLLNFIVDKVYQYILHHGLDLTDSLIIRALKHNEKLLLLEGPDAGE